MFFVFLYFTKVIDRCFCFFTFVAIVLIVCHVINNEERARTFSQMLVAPKHSFNSLQSTASLA